MDMVANTTELVNLKGSRPEIDDLIQQIVSESSLVHLSKHDLNYLYREKEVLKRRIYSFPHEKESRMEAVIREMMEYSQIDFLKYDRVILLIETSPDKPLLMSELGVLNEIIDLFPKRVEVKWGLGWNRDIGDKAFLMMVCSC